ncbi:MAG TPA: YdcF family protein [Sphingobacteriaceae bacterium]|nr:YdcF family protein [Sphingobacteriaceae bacterium]
MFFILSKTIYYVLMPQVWILLLLLYGIFTKDKKRRKKCLVATLVMFIIFSNSFLINEGLLWWEEKPVPIASLSESQTAIVLTGVANSQKSSNDRVYFGKVADRVLHTVQLYKAGKVNKILISGGSGSLTGSHISEADQLKKVFLYCGVLETDILLENKSRNTYESAQECKKLVYRLAIKQDILLITSAFHMKRSQGCFSKAGLRAEAFPVDYFTADRKNMLTPDRWLIPSSDAMSKWAMLMHEITGYVTYKLMGYC